MREFRAKERAQKSKVENKLALTLQNGGMFGFTFFILQYLFHFISDVTTKLTIHYRMVTKTGDAGEAAGTR